MSAPRFTSLLRPATSSIKRIGSDDLAPVESLTATLSDGFTFQYLVINPGCEKLVMAFHGLSASPKVMLVWRRVAKRYGVTIIAPYNPNHGGTGDVTTCHEFMERIAQFMREFDFVGLDAIGHSLGGVSILVLKHVHKDLHIQHVFAWSMPSWLSTSRTGLVLQGSATAADVLATVGLLLAKANPSDRRILLDALQEMTHSPTRMRFVNMWKVFRSVPDYVRESVRQSGDQHHLVFAMLDTIRASAHHMHYHLFQMPYGHNWPLYESTWNHVFVMFEAAGWVPLPGEVAAVEYEGRSLFPFFVPRSATA